ncbi:MAG TPA: PspA/IM30 family protein [Ktedonobacteraceae bacterium]|nr:PspA/IM30 family protein [Ktedonobacteraceae bacterium]
MNLLERVLTLLRANLNTVIEKADDPEQSLRQLQLDMHNQLVQVKTQVATAIAAGHHLRKRSQERGEEAQKWWKKAEQAIQQNNDDAARTALAHYNDLNKQAQLYQQQQKDQEQLATTLRGVLHQLEAKISEVETTIDLLVTRKRNALIQQRVFEALNKADNAKDKGLTAKAQDAVMEAEARARALADLRQRDLTAQLDQLSADQLVEEQLHTLKQQNSSGTLPLLEEGEPHLSPLQPPQPRSGEPARKRDKEQPAPGISTGDLAKGTDLEHLKKLLETPLDRLEPS